MPEQQQRPEQRQRRRVRRRSGSLVNLLALSTGVLSVALCSAWQLPAPTAQRGPHQTRCRASRHDECSSIISRGAFAARSLSLALGGALLGAATMQQGSPLPPAAQARTEPLGVINEILADCARTDNCASSQDDRPPVFAEPWAYESSAEKAMKRLREYVAAMPGAEVITADDRYLRVEFRSQDAIDDAEWFFVDPESDAIIEFRSARRGDKGDNGANLRRLEKIRIALGLEKVPVLRNRRRALFIMESPLDAFGPSYGVDAPPPQELGEVYKDADPFSPTWDAPPPYARPAPQRPRGK